MAAIEETITMKVIEHFFLFPEEEIFILLLQFNLTRLTEKNAIELQCSLKTLIGS